MEINSGGYAWEDVETVLRRRGHAIAKRGDPKNALFDQSKFIHAGIAYERAHGEDDRAHGAKERQRVVGRNVFERYTERYGQTEMRRMLGRLISAPNRTATRSDLKTVAGRRCEPNLEYLVAVELIKVEGEEVQLLPATSDLGPSLEQYVQMMCMHDLRGHAEWGVNLEGVGTGDFDVIAWLPPTLVYFECKAANPNNVEASSLRQMLKRTRNLAADLTILVIDTSYDIASLASKVQRSEKGVGVNLTLQQRAGGIYYGVFQHWPIYAINADPSILTQVRRCLRHYHSFGKWRELETLSV